MTEGGPAVLISTNLDPADDATKVLLALQSIFPTFRCDISRFTTSFPVMRKSCELSSLDCDLDQLLELTRDQRILDTALDAMSLNLHRGRTWFMLSRQAALANKISFVLPREAPLGGVIRVVLESDRLEQWLEDVTWHHGREHVPRSIGDQRGMYSDGAVREWN